MIRPARILLLLLAGTLALGAGLYGAYRYLHTPFRGYDGDAVHVEIPRGAHAREVAERLSEGGVIRRPEPLLWLLWLRGETSSIRAGEYRFERPRSVVEVTEILVDGRVHLESVTIPEGYDRWEVARALAGAGFGSYEEALRATERTVLVEGIDPEATSLEGYLFPDTYRTAAGTPVEEVVETMVDTFRDVWTPQRRARARELEMSPREVVTLASLVEAEARLPEERELISAVFHNRLQRGMLLQCDPTLLYALYVERGRTDRNIRRGDFDLDSPYNTYRYPGLPVGPIGNPGLESLDAALRPADVEYLYFVARNDGSHVFSRTLQEHNAMVDRYQR